MDGRRPPDGPGIPRNDLRGVCSSSERACRPLGSSTISRATAAPGLSVIGIVDDSIAATIRDHVPYGGSLKDTPEIVRQLVPDMS